jgi:enoyl-CoA hydratase/3-hydroxyacyl-CoA dehydrogenase
MSDGKERPLHRLAVIGAGNMGSGIAQKMATEGFPVTLVDLDEEKVARGIASVERGLAEGVERKIFRRDEADAIRGRLHGTHDWKELREADLVVEAVFEDRRVKKEVFERLDQVCRPDAVLATNTSSFSVGDVAAATKRPGRVLGLHYFYHPAKNRLVEVVPGKATERDVLRSAWALQERLGKTPIASTDRSGFVVNRFFVPWLNEAVRILEEGVADLPTIEEAAKRTFGIGMGPFELMNVTGVPISLHASTTLGEAFGPFYAPAALLAKQTASGKPWPLGGTPDPAVFDIVSDRLLAVVFYVAGTLVQEAVGTIEDTDIGARVGLRWPKGPFEMMNRAGMEEAVSLLAPLMRRWNLEVPEPLAERVRSHRPFEFVLVRTDVADGIATLTINRPDSMNALNEAVVAQLHGAFRAAASNPAVRGIVIAGSGKAFVAGADIRFFVKAIDSGDLDRIVRFTRAGHDLLNAIDTCPKPVVARLHGLALGGGVELALACDRIVATPKAALSFPETGIGIYPGLGGTQRATRRVGVGIAKWLIGTGELLTAEEARAVGLVDAVVPHEDLDRAVREALAAASGAPARPELSERHRTIERFFASNDLLAVREGKVDAGQDAALAKAVKRISSKAPVALRLAQELIEKGGAGKLEAGLAMELDHLLEIFRTRDAYEGLSTVGKRAPAFEGR